MKFNKTTIIIIIAIVAVVAFFIYRSKSQKTTEQKSVTSNPDSTVGSNVTSGSSSKAKQIVEIFEGDKTKLKDFKYFFGLVGGKWESTDKDITEDWLWWYVNADDSSEEGFLTEKQVMQLQNLKFKVSDLEEAYQLMVLSE